MLHFNISESTLPDDYEQLVEILCTLSEKFFYAAQLQKALQVLEHGKRLINDGGHNLPEQLARIFIQRGRILIWTSLMGENSLKEADCSLKWATQLAYTANNEQLLAYAKLYLGHCLDFKKVFMDEGDWHDALAQLHQSHEVFLKVDDKVGQNTAVFFIGLIHQRLSQKEEAIQHFEQALDLARQNQNKFIEAEAIRHLGFFTYLDGKLDETFIYAKDSLRLFEEIDCKITLSSANHAVGMIQEAQDNLAEALSTYEKAHSLAQEYSLRLPLMQALMGLSSICEKNEQVEDAVKYAKQAKEVAQETGYSAYIKMASDRIENFL